MTQASNNTNKGGTVDRCGAFASTICAVHCLACALLPATLAALGLDFLIGHDTAWLLTIIAVLFGLTALVLSLRSHRNILILLALSVGIVGLLSARVLEGGAHHDDHGSDTHEAQHGDNEAHTKGAEASHKSEKSAEATHKADKEHHASESAEGHDEHEGHADGHMAIEALSVSAGILLVIGHISNLVLLRRRQKDVDSTDCATV